jgi:hypothetical protein
MSNSIDPKLSSIPFNSAIPDTTPTPSCDGSSQYPPNSRATDSNFGLPTSHRVPPSNNPHPTTEKDQLDANPQVNVNRAKGVEPTDKHSVQVRRKEVSTCCLMLYGFVLDALTLNGRQLRDGSWLIRCTKSSDSVMHHH